MGLIPEWYDENVTMGVLMGPCTSPADSYFGSVYTPEIWQFLNDNQIYAFAGGVDWDAKMNLINTEGPEALKAMMPALSGLPNNPV